MKTNKVVNYHYEEESNHAAVETNLQMEDLIGLFENEINEMVDFDSFEYENYQKAIHIFRGSPKLHKCHYKITIADIGLGEITLTRNVPFKDDEMIIIECALGALSIRLNDTVID